MLPQGRIVAVCTSRNKGERKVNIDQGELVENFGLAGDSHAGEWHRQVSLLAEESIAKMHAAGLDVGPGDFAENLTTCGIDLPALPVGSLLRLQSGAELEVTQIGKECHNRCAIYDQAGDCVMPKEGIFARVCKGGRIACQDRIEVIRRGPARGGADD
jgi:MOSC domain-containing protein YiiM